MVRVIAALLLIAASAQAQTVCATTGCPYQWVGNTSVTYPRGEGTRAPTQQCQSDYHPSARICRTSEVLDTIVLPTAPATRGRLWGDAYESCAFWGTREGSYSTVHPNGKIEKVPCNAPEVKETFACCRPILLPDPTSAIQGAVLVVSYLLMHLSPRAS